MKNFNFPGATEIPLSTAIEWSKKLKSTKSSDAKRVNAYLIPIESLEAVLKLKKSAQIDAVRAYVGINDSDEENLIFVGAKLDPETGIYKDVFGAGVTNRLANTAYDGSRPCPPCEDPDSPLY